MILVHVIPPAGHDGDRHEVHFPDGTSDEDIFLALRVCGGPRPTDPPLQDGFGRLKGGEKYLDNPGTVVAVGRAANREFVETRRLQGQAT